MFCLALNLLCMLCQGSGGPSGRACGLVECGRDRAVRARDIPRDLTRHEDALQRRAPLREDLQHREAVQARVHVSRKDQWHYLYLRASAYHIIYICERVRITLFISASKCASHYL